MDLEKEAKRMAAEFHYSKRALNEGVKQFITEMREGLEKQGAQMSQIPTYVTSVPNGTEKVPSRISIQPMHTLTSIGYFPGGRPRRHQFPRLLRYPSWEPYLLHNPVQSRCSAGPHGNTGCF